MRKLFALLMLASSVFAQQQVQPVAGVLTLNLVPGTSSFKVILSANVTSVVIQNPTPGTIISVIFTENATGGFTVTFGGNITSSCNVNPASNATTTCQFQYDATNNTWNSIGGSSDPQGGGTATFPTIACNGYLVKQGDFLIENSTGNAGANSFTLTWRMILTTGERKEFQQTGLGGSGGNSPLYNGFPLVEGCLVGGSLTLIGSGTDSGAIFAQVFLGRNFTQVPNTSSIQLIGCPLSANYSTGWNGTSAATCRMPTDGQGFNQTITFTNPAAGANLVNGALSGPTIVGQKHWLANVRFTLTSSATAQARQACITFKDAAGNVVYGNCIQGTQAASLIVNYDFTAGVGAQYTGAATLTVIPSTNVAATANEVQGTLPSNFQFSDASTISITIIGIQAADQISNIVVRTFWSHHVTD